MNEARWLDRNAAAAYVGRRVDELPRLVKRGLLPVPSLHFGPKSPRWDRAALDAMFVGSQAAPDYDAMVANACETLKTPSRARRSQNPR